MPTNKCNRNERLEHHFAAKMVISWVGQILTSAYNIWQKCQWYAGCLIVSKYSSQIIYLH